MASNRESILERCAVSAATGLGFYLLARFVNHRWHMNGLQQQLQESQASLEHERVKRAADRMGRIRAEQELRAVKVQLQRLQLQLQLQPNAATATAVAREDTDLGLAETTAGTEAVDGALGKDGMVAASHGDEDQEQAKEKHLLPRQQKGVRQQLDQQAEGAPVNGRKELEGRLRRRGSAGIMDGSGGGSMAGRTEAATVGAAATTSADVANDPLKAKRAAAAAAAALAAAGSTMPAFPFRPIGHLQSVFSERNGTPRQPQLVPAARSRLVLCPNVSAACLDGLDQYSHCWILYVFHANTDLAKYLSPDRTGLKAKINVPRLNGARMGVLATRSPHRPSPIGLSTAQIIGLEGNSLVLGGADIVDGSPVLDIKPYVPFCDCLTAARAPAWVQAEAEDEPLAVREVLVDETACSALTRAWHSRKANSMYKSAEQYLDLVRQVLSRDIRSVHQRLNVRPTSAVQTCTAATAGTTPRTSAPTVPGLLRHQQTGAQTSSRSGEGVNSGGEYHVVLENIYISYDITSDGVVRVYDAWIDPITARG